MSKLNETLKLLSKLGISKQQQNDRSALTILAITHIHEDSEWTEAVQQTIIIHDIIEFIRDNYDIDYAENSRETIRRQTIHQFEQAGLLIKNIDEPDRPTNSPKTNYAASDALLKILHSIGTEDFESNLNEFGRNQGRLVEIYNRHRKGHEITIQVNGKKLNFSPGEHNKLQIEIIQELKPRFFSEAELLYVGDTADKMLYLNTELINKLGLPINQHDKLPDVVYYEEKRNLLYLIEAVTSHGPMTPKRIIEIEDALKGLDCLKIYMSAFPDVKEFKKHISEISWETEVWIADNPEHMIHFNGSKFLTGIK